MIQKLRSKIAILLICLMPFAMSGCDENGNFDVNKLIDMLLGMLGWNPQNENTDTQDDADPYEPGEVTAASKDWSSDFPPVGNQGNYGTCVVWATGYAMKTALDKIDNPQLDVNNTSNQASPVDLWHLIDSGSKSKGCDGTNFDPAFTAMINNGVASMADVPFSSNSMQCDVTGRGNTGKKLNSYRIIAYTNELSGSGSYGMTVDNFKGYLVNHGPIAIGARLGENFMSWSNSAILSSDTQLVQGQHAYHALVVVGFDDSKRAFRIRNSWGKDTWGDQGSIWIDYDFFINSFCFGAWVASNANDLVTRSGSSDDLSVKLIKDYETADGQRVVEYDIENTGNGTIRADKNWSAVYLLFRSHRLSEKYLLFDDHYSYAATKGISSYSDGMAVHASENAVTNVDIAPGSSAAQALGGSKISFTYDLPLDKNGNKLNGDFYMVLVADAFGSIGESNKENNVCFITGSKGEPIKIVDGKITNMPTEIKPLRTLATGSDPNNYSGVEVQQALQRQFRNGALKKFIQQESGLRSERILKEVK